MRNLLLIFIALLSISCASTQTRPAKAEKVLKKIAVFPFTDAKTGTANYGITVIDTAGSGSMAQECLKNMLYSKDTYFELIDDESLDAHYDTFEQEIRNFMGAVSKRTLKKQPSYETANELARNLGADYFVLGEVTNYTQAMHTSVGMGFGVLSPIGVGGASAKVGNLSQAAVSIRFHQVEKKAPLFIKSCSAESKTGFHGAFEKIAEKSFGPMRKYK